MIQFLKDISIFDLLGLSLSEEKQNAYITKMLKPVIINSIRRGIKESDLGEDEIDRIQSMIDSNTPVGEIEIEAVKAIPQLLSIIQEETYLFKKNALIQQLNMIRSQLTNKQTEQLKYFKSIIDDLEKKLGNSNESDFENTWNLYNQQRKNFLKQN